MNKVWEVAPYADNTLLTLLALADWADEQGVCWPKLASIAKKSRQSERNARYCISRLLDDGWITISQPARGHQPRKLQINLHKLGRQELHLSDRPEGQSVAPQGGNSRHTGGQLGTNRGAIGDSA